MSHFAAALAILDNPANAEATEDMDNMRDALTNLTVSGAVKYFTAREWFEMHSGRIVDTVQWTPNSGMWVPTGRTVNTDRRTYVTLDGSRRDYSNLRVFHAREGVLWCELPFKGQASGWVLYTVR